MLRQFHSFAYILALCGAVIAAQDSGDPTGTDSVTLFPSNPTIDYRPAYYCADFRYRNCYGWNYVWQTAVYEDQRTSLNRSVAFTTTPSENVVGNGVREISLTIPRAREVYVYGAPRAWTRSHRFLMAPLELCIDHWDRPCVQLDVQDTYSLVINEHEPVLIWSGRLPGGMGRETLTLTLRVAGSLNSVTSEPRLMTLDSVVCTGLSRPFAQQPYHDLPADSKTHEAVVDDLDTVITYRPSDRWNTTAKAEHGGAFQTITQASTIYGGGASTPMPELTLDITACTAVTIWSAPPAFLKHRPGGVRICLDRVCEVVDVFQIYLNPASAPSPSTSIESPHNASADSFGEAELATADIDGRPVAIWSASGLDYRRAHRLSVTLIERNPPLDKDYIDRLRTLALDYVTYTEVVGAERHHSPGISDGMIVLITFSSLAGVLLLAWAGCVSLQYVEKKKKLRAEYTPINSQHVHGAYSWTGANSSYSSTSSTTPPAYTPSRG